MSDLGYPTDITSSLYISVHRLSLQFYSPCTIRDRHGYHYVTGQYVVRVVAVLFRDKTEATNVDNARAH